MSVGRKATKNVKNLKMESDQRLYSTPSGRNRFKQKKNTKGSKNSIDYINVINEENMYGNFESSSNGEEKDRYIVSNDNYINAQVNFGNCGVCTVVTLSIISSQLLNQFIL